MRRCRLRFRLSAECITAAGALWRPERMTLMLISRFILLLMDTVDSLETLLQPRISEIIICLGFLSLCFNTYINLDIYYRIRLISLLIEHLLL